MEKKKLAIKMTKALFKSFGYTLSAGAAALVIFTAYRCLVYGGVVYYEISRLISFLELGMGAFALIFCIVQIVKLIRKPE